MFCLGFFILGWAIGGYWGLLDVKNPLSFEGFFFTLRFVKTARFAENDANAMDSSPNLYFTVDAII